MKEQKFIIEEVKKHLQAFAGNCEKEQISSY